MPRVVSCRRCALSQIVPQTYFGTLKVVAKTELCSYFGDIPSDLVMRRLYNDRHISMQLISFLQQFTMFSVVEIRMFISMIRS